MFSWINKQGVRSDLGFEVQFTGRFDAEYREGSRVIKLYVESGVDSGMPCILLEPSAFEKWSDGSEISKEQQEKIFKNFRRAMEFQGLKIFVEDRVDNWKI